MPVFDRQNEWAGSLNIFSFRPHRIVHLDPSLKQPENHVFASFANSKKQRSKPRWKRRTKVGTSFEKSINDFDMTVGCGPHQGRLSLAFTSVNVCTVRNESLDRP